MFHRRRPHSIGSLLAALVLVAGAGLAVPCAADAQDRSAARTRSGSSGSSSKGTATRSSSSRSSGSRSVVQRSGGSSGRTAVSRGSREVGERRYRPGDDRGHRGTGYGRWVWDPYYHGYHYGFGGWPWIYGWGGWYGGWYGPGWGRGPYIEVQTGPAYYGHRMPGAGAIDFDVSPEKAEIWLDGEPIGVADQYDGWPTYLWLEPGTYDVVVYKEGYETIARQMTVRPGLVIDVEDRMREGASTRPEELVARSTVNRDERLRRNRERVGDLERPGSLDWRDRVARERDRDRDPRAEPSERPHRLDVRAAPGRLELDVTPEDAAVYLDGTFVGTARELGRLGSELLLDPGSHELEVVRPGYESEVVRFDLESDETVDLAIDLDG